MYVITYEEVYPFSESRWEIFEMIINTLLASQESIETCQLNDST